MNKTLREQGASIRTRCRLLLAMFVLCFSSASLRADSDVTSASPVPVGKVIVIKMFTTLVKPLKPQDYEREIDIYLPAAYINDRSKTLRFPVIYLLHGSPGNPNDFVKNGHWQYFLEQTAQADNFLPPILIAPNGNYEQAAFGDSEWLNSADSENKFEDLIVSEVVPWVDKHYRTIPTAGSRTIAGVSEGGYGAVNIALHAPTVFGNVIALSGYYNNDGSGWARRIMGHSKEFLAYNSPLSFLESPVEEAKYLSDWQTQRYFIGSGLDEKRYTTESKEMSDELREHKINSDLCQLDGKHGWELWNTLFVAGVTDIFSPNRPAMSGDTPVPQQAP